MTPEQRPGGSGRRNERGRERNRSGVRKFSATAPGERTRHADPARLVAFEVLRAVAADDAYANLVLPTSIRRHRLGRQDAGFATELAYGALRGQGTYDAILALCVDRPLEQLDPAVLDALRLGVHQLMAMRVPPHAALDQTVGLARAVIGAGPSSLINAVLRKVSRRSFTEWLEELTGDIEDAVRISSLQYSHPEWIVRTMRGGLVGHGRPVAEIDALLAADNAAPVVNLVALPGIGTLDEAFEAGARPGELVEGSALFAAGDVGRLESVRSGKVRVQDAGSQLVARALAAAPIDRMSEDREEWLDLCAGPGGKSALLAAIAAQHGHTLVANEPAEHRAALVRQSLAAVAPAVWTVRVGDGRTIGSAYPDGFDRILVDAPCTGLGALRRRPEARWRRKPSDLAELGPLQRELLSEALETVRPGGVVAYVTCSPHPAETSAVVQDALRGREGYSLIDAGSVLDSVSKTGSLQAGHELTAQLWPHVHGTDAMFLALIRRAAN